MKRARLIAAVTACWLTAVQPLLRRPDDLALPVDELPEQLKVFVIDIHRPGPLPFNEDRILLLARGPWFWSDAC